VDLVDVGFLGREVDIVDDFATNGAEDGADE